MELKVESEKVLASAAKCPEWKDGLKELFPEAFERDKKHFNLRELKCGCSLFTTEEARRAGFGSYTFMQIRGNGKYADIAFLLEDTHLEWALERDDVGKLCLTVERKD